MAEEKLNICLLWGDWQIHQWWSCMNRSDWAAWVQAFGVLLTLIFMSYQIFSERRKANEVNHKRSISDAITMKYYLRQHKHLTIYLDLFISSYEMQYKYYVEIKNQSKKGKVIEEAIGCFLQSADYYWSLADNLEKLDFDKRDDLHLNNYAHFLDDIISGAKSLEYLFQQYRKKEAELKEMANGIFHFDDMQKENYFNTLENRYPEWIAYVDASHAYFLKIINGWKGITSAVTKSNIRKNEIH